MDAITALLSRVSVSRLTEPAPDEESLRNIYRSAMRAADHALLRPWRFLIIRDQSRQRLADLFVAASLKEEPDLPTDKLESIRSKPLRAPVILVAICSPKPHPTVPQHEQELATGAAMQNMLNAAHAQGIGAIWRTGPMAENDEVMQGLGLTGAEKIIGFLYLGQILGETRVLRELPIDDYFVPW